MKLFGDIDPLKDAYDIMAEALDLYNPSKVFGLFSGGHDSLVSTHLASQLKLFAGAVHINTGIGVEETRQYVRQTCKERGWPLREMKSHITYESLVRRFGFPGPAGHQMMYSRLKERCLRQLVRENKSGLHDRIMLIGGMRKDESTRRVGTTEPHSREGCRVWCAPLTNWTTDQRNAFIDKTRLPKNPVVAKLCMSGECLCGAFAKPHELAEIAYHYPATARQIHELQGMAKAAGVHCEWGKRPPKKEPESETEPQLFSLCWSCGNK